MPRRQRPHDGFTLIELLVTLAIVAILSAIAYPSYATYVLRTRRLEGKVALFEAMQQQENVYSRSWRYAAFSADAPSAGQGGKDGDADFKWWSGASAALSAYELRTQPCAGSDLARCVEVFAIPGTARVDSAFRDPGCGVLTLSSTGERRAQGAERACWP
ncbi:type IV pilin protein [Massilia sp. PWRC2]|uniref:type IV pilin protein n=1 Tax=Massilia sp. PWRC2 TaxID=2804626 RepID=UPI003CF29D12